jgi:hypothetical protein
MNNTHQHAPDGRHVFHWKGLDRQRDIGELADAIAAAVPGLFDLDGRAMQLDAAGELHVVAFEKFKSLLDKHICYVRCVKNGAGWQREYLPFAFAPAVRYDPLKGGPMPKPDNSRPDAKVLEELYQREVNVRLPKVA